MRLRAPVPFVLAAALVAPAAAAPAQAVTFRQTFSQTTPVLLGDGGDGPSSSSFVPDSGPADSYPDEDSYAEGAGRLIIDVDVYLDLDHGNVDDLEVLLVGPGGQQALLMANAGGDTAFNGRVGFDDEASDDIPDNGPLVDDVSFRPKDYSPSALPSPAPALNGNSALSVFDGTSPVGTWKMYVLDDAVGNDGSFNWYVEIETATTPYPSSIAVSGLGSVTDVNVSLDNLTSTYPDDVDLLLVGPEGQQATLMSDNGGSPDVTDVDLTIDDEAAGPLPNETALVSGTYQPTNVDESDDVYPAPAPAPSGATSLSAFDGTHPNGTWRLFAWDSVGGDYTTIQGWSLDIESSDTAGPSGSVTIASGATAIANPAVTLTLAATDPAPGVGVSQMQFSNDGTTWSPFQPYAATAAWTLAAGADGARTVFVRYADGVGNVSAAASDTVVLDTTAPLVKKVTPAKNAKGVNPKTKVRIKATEALNPATVTAKNVVLKLGKKRIKARLSLKRGTVVVLQPRKPLAEGTYRVVAKRLADLVGNRLDGKKGKPGTQKVTWKFTV